jgi:rubrerythrin
MKNLLSHIDEKLYVVEHVGFNHREDVETALEQTLKALKILVTACSHEHGNKYRDDECPICNALQQITTLMGMESE